MNGTGATAPSVTTAALAATVRRAFAGGAAFGATFLVVGIAFAAGTLFGPGSSRPHGDRTFDNLAFGAYMIAVLALANAAGYAIVAAIGGAARAGTMRRALTIGALMGAAGFLVQLLGIPYVLLGAVPFRDRIPGAAAMAVVVSPGVLAGLLAAIVTRFASRTGSIVVPKSGAQEES